jgi:hypothetical protein
MPSTTRPTNSSTLDPAFIGGAVPLIARPLSPVSMCVGRRVDDGGAPVEVEGVEREGLRVVGDALGPARDGHPRPLPPQRGGQRRAQHTRRARHQGPRPVDLHVRDADQAARPARGERPKRCSARRVGCRP